MMKHRILKLAAAAACSGAVALGSVAGASTLPDVFRVADQLNRQARSSQAKIDALTDETRNLLNEYKTVLKEVEGLKVYNRQLQKQVTNQEEEMANLAQSIDDVTLIERQIMPQMLSMIEGVEQLIALDLPFLPDERAERVNRLREAMDRSDVAVSEKFNQVFRAFQIENDYGRTMEAYDDEIQVGDQTLNVTVLRLGRISLSYQTADGAQTGWYNPASDAWEPLDDNYRESIRDGIRMARKQLSTNIVTVPVTGPTK